MAGWIVKCHRRTGCDAMAWLAKPPQPITVLEKPRLIGELASRLPSGWVATYWDLHHTRILEQTEECVAARPHYFCSESCQQVGCNPTSDPLSPYEEDAPPCTVWASSVEVPREVVAQIVDAAVKQECAESGDFFKELGAQIVAAAVKQEREEVDALLAVRTKECFCVEYDSPCESCFVVSSIRGTLSGRSK